jgi:hypothetical protein
MVQNYTKNNYLTQIDCALLYGVATTKTFNGVSTIHKGANEFETAKLAELDVSK